MRLEVYQATVGLDGDEFAGGVHEIAKPSKRLLKAIAAAEAIGAVKAHASKDERATMDAAVESQAESEKKLAKAQETGEWHKANLDLYIHDARTRLERGEESDETHAALRVGLEEAERVKAHLVDGLSYEQAVTAAKGQG